jgi:hypothetical protein
MSLQLHTAYTFEEAIASFQGEYQLLCDNQFAVFSDIILCFVTIGEYGKQSYLSAPREVVWKPSRLDYAPSEAYSWFPTDARETYDRSGTEIVKLRNHHILLRALESEDFIYVGRAHLGSYGGSEGTANFSLDKKIPYDIWLTCGGYTGWQIYLGHEVHIIERGDCDSFERLLSQLNTANYSHIDISQYEPSSLSIYTNPECAHLKYYGAEECLIVDRFYRGSARKVFSCDCGIELESLEHETVSRELAIKISKHYLETGNLPMDVEWASTSWDDDEYYREEDLVSYEEEDLNNLGNGDENSIPF